jgi:DNA-binding MarR family transcriptional regulator
VTIDAAISLVQFCYPQVYYACHTRHERKRSSALRLSRRDSELLVHLDRSRPAALTDVARHMDLAPSTVSEAVTKLEALGYVQKAPASTGDRRRIGLVLTAKGVDAVRATSVLEPARLRGVLKRLSNRELATVTDGLTILAEACRPARPERVTQESRPDARPERVARESRPDARPERVAQESRPDARPERVARESRLDARPERVARESRPERRGWGPGALKKSKAQP